ncbi:hypothetical protein DVH24_018865 [Malus domestica]|uniref:Uncharacterized protein n=1 Tax=Malus domestica TaxID=3750 RepID=A0A498HLB9_MALDO|nr:hypothetical protein DVH24_018865 [Malus domestica]
MCCFVAGCNLCGNFFKLYNFELQKNVGVRDHHLTNSLSDAYNQCDDLLSNLMRLLECIQKEMDENKHASSSEIATWIEMKSWREPKKAKLNETVPSVVKPAKNEEIIDPTKGKNMLGQ